MSFFDNIGGFKIGGSVDAQFQTSNAVERMMIASGKQVGGFTSFLATIEFIGFILLIALSLFIIATLSLIYIIQVLKTFIKMLHEDKYKTILVTDSRIPNDEPMQVFAFDNVKDIESFKKWYPDVFNPTFKGSDTRNYIKVKDMNWHIEQGETIILRMKQIGVASFKRGSWTENDIWWSTLGAIYSELNLEVSI
jgi:hypothetical protein